MKKTNKKKIENLGQKIVVWLLLIAMVVSIVASFAIYLIR